MSRLDPDSDPRAGRAAADHMVRSPGTQFTEEFSALAAPFMDDARQGMQTVHIRYHGQAKSRREQELREELA